MAATARETPEPTAAHVQGVVIDGLEPWLAEHEAWQTVFAANANHTPYQSFDWLLRWWHSFGNGRLHIVKVVDRSGAVLGFAPLYQRPRYFGLPLKHLSFIGDKRTDYLDFLVLPGRESEFFTGLFECLYRQRQRYHFLEFRDMPADSSNLEPLLAASERWFPVHFREANTPCVAIPLADSWEAQLATLGKRTRKDVGYDRRYLERRCDTRLAEYRDWNEVEPLQPGLAEVYRQRWDATLGSTRYDHPASAQFESEVLQAFAAQGRLRLWVLYVDEQPVAWLDGYIQHNKVYADTNVHAPAYHQYSVGNVLIGHVLESCIGEGLEEFDLSRGDEPYKKRWGGQVKNNQRLLLATHSLRLAAAVRAKQFYEWTATNGSLQSLLAMLRRRSTA